VQDFQDLIDSTEPVILPSTGPGANDFITPDVLAAIYGFETEMVTGFQGSSEARPLCSRGTATRTSSPGTACPTPSTPER
jgi:hypothetical protein